MLQPRSKFPKLLAKWAAVLSFFGIFCYPIIIAPMMDPSDYQRIQKISRKDIDQEKIQPGNMKIWSDPFNRK